jgi:glycine cleavage system aminomethyltransferase T
MTTKRSLEDRISGWASPARMLRNSPVGPYPFPYPAEHSNWRDEQRAWNTTALLFDQSFHMTDVYFKGPDLIPLLARTGINSFKTFGRNKAKQFIAVNHDGYMISDAILFGLEDDEANLVGTPLAANWVQFIAETEGYDVTVTRDERTVENDFKRFTYRYELTGPNTLQILHKAAGGPIEPIKFFTMGEFSIAGTPVRGLNHTMSIVPGSDMSGIEIFGPAEHSDTVLNAIMAAGAEFGLLRGGALAYSSTIAESGWLGTYVPAIYTGDQMRAYRERVGENTLESLLSLGGSFTSDNVEDYYVTPWDLGYGNMIKLDHDFIGREALERKASDPHRRKVWLQWNADDVTRVIGSSMFDPESSRAKYLAQPYGIYAFTMYDTVLSAGSMVGFSTLMAYTVNLGAWFSLGMIDEAAAQDGAEVTVIWGEQNGGSDKPTVERHAQTEIRATIRTSSPALSL